ncbi:MAG: peptidoglycan DD-metalloendopeptidase family protein, partial [Oscillospiraceae bacterium]|nr:peptidoglycan DD-metalloendopeptidase family protein [Oscillospiraceae bacterium]
RSTAFACMFCLLCGIIGNESAITLNASSTQAELEAEIEKNKQEIAKLEDKITATDGEISESEELQGYYYSKLLLQQEGIDLLNNKLYAKEQEIAAKEEEIAAKEVEIVETERKIEDKKIEIAKLEQQNEENLYQFGQVMRTMYMNDTEDVLNVLAGSTDFYDIFVKKEIMDNVGEQNEEFMNKLLDDIHKLEDDKVQLEQDVAKLQQDKADLETEKAALQSEWDELDSDKAYANQLANQYTAEYNDVTSHISDLESLKDQYNYQISVSKEEIAAYEKEIDEIIRRAQLAASNTAVYDEGAWLWPLDPKFTLITTYFGYDPWRGGNHGAIDIGNGGINGANIYAMKGGEVIVAKTTYTPGYDYGMYVVIDHGNGYQSLYAHCSAIYVTVGQMVNKGDVIASVGSTGWSTGPHLHFEIRKDGTRVDPLEYVDVP